MQLVDECFFKVKTASFKYISSQENNKEKFKNKDRMIRSFLIPICFWISKKAKKKSPLIIGLGGGQGSGKTTITSILSLILKKYFKLKVFKISIDDFYKTRKERKTLSENKHPLLLTRGVPGTHDINIMLDFFINIKVKSFKSLKWRQFVNFQLKTKYKKLYKQLDGLLYLNAKNFNLLKKWRTKQEKKLRLKAKNKKNLKIMNKKEIISFMQTYQRITEQMFKDAPKYSSIIMNLNRNHQIQKIRFN